MMSKPVFTELKNINVERNGDGSKLGPKRDQSMKYIRNIGGNFGQNYQKFFILGLYFFLTFMSFFLGKSMKLI